jgi:tripartite ATP-independent transporter DctP family solute receptor
MMIDMFGPCVVACAMPAAPSRRAAMRRRDVLGGSAGLITTIVLARTVQIPAFAQASMTLKASDVHPPGYPTVVAVETMGDKLQQATNGRLSVQMFASMQLGGEKEAIEQAQVGALQMARVSVGAIGPVIDDLNVFNLPFLFRNTAHMQEVIDGPIGSELLDKVTANEKAGLVGLCWMDAGARSFYNTRHPIKSIADLKGLKVRVIGNPMFVDMANALGANGVAMGYDQVFSALQTGVIDGAENNPPSFVFDNHYQVAKNYTLTEHLIVPEVLVFSKKSWDALSKDDQALIKKFAGEAQAEERVLWAEYEEQAMDKARAGGVQIVETIDKQPFQDAVKPVWDKYGPRFSELIKRIQAIS